MDAQTGPARGKKRPPKTADNLFDDIRFDGEMAYVTLTKGYVAVIDAADAPLVGRYNWGAHVKPTIVYATARAKPEDGVSHIQMHAVICRAPAGLTVDHRDGDGLNNRRSNLRPSTGHQQGSNKRLSGRGGSRRIGVSWSEVAGRWRARIAVDGRQQCLGYHDTEEAAAEAYLSASRELRGEFHRSPLPTMEAAR